MTAKTITLTLVCGALAMATGQKSPSVAKTESAPVGVQSTFSYVWIVPSKTGVILVDAGNEPTAQPVVDALKAAGKTPEDVRAILITHGHHDHLAGISRFRNADVYIAAGDSAMLKEKPARLKVLQGATVTVDSVTFGVIPIPGHTAGSVAYEWNNFCFTGDVITKNDGKVAYGPDNYSQSPEKNRESVKSLLKLQFSSLGTGHGGVVTREEFEKFLQGK
jgi:glyoxylase-like metal-dependent hydrolase (beta-lactamase superfamily II)